MSLEHTSALRRQFAHDSHRPVYHFLPPSNWMNDPNGVIQWQGKYHLFYQYNPNGPLWGDIHWGHAISPDLVHWEDLPLALAPTPGSPDEAGCFSGCAVDNGLPTLIYTGTRGERNEIQTQCLATSHDDLLTWQKYDRNPILSAIPAESGQNSDFRDPFVWQEADGWYMVLGSRIKDVGGAVFLFRSANLTEWEYLHPLLVGDSHRSGAIWECPNFFQLDDRWVLIISSHTGVTTDRVLYFVGTYENHQFTPTHSGEMVLDYGHLYAPLTMRDDQNRRLLIGWLREARSSVDQQWAGWSGVQSIPRVLHLDERDRLLMQPIPDLETIRGQRHHYATNQAPTLAEVTSLALDIAAEFDPTPSATCGLSLVTVPGDQERLDIYYDPSSQQLVARQILPEANAADSAHTREVPHELAAGEAFTLRILLDGSVVEIIANERTSLTSRIYPPPDVRLTVQPFEIANWRSLDIWEMLSIWR